MDTRASHSSISFIVPLSAFVLILGIVAGLVTWYLHTNAMERSLELLILQDARDYERRALFIANYINDDEPETTEEIFHDLDRYVRVESIAPSEKTLFLLDATKQVLYSSSASVETCSDLGLSDSVFDEAQSVGGEEVSSRIWFLHEGTPEECFVVLCYIPIMDGWFGFARPVRAIREGIESYTPPLQNATTLINLVVIPISLLTLFGASIFLLRRYRGLAGVFEASAERYRQLSENSNSIILRWNPSGVITYANPKALQFFGYTRSEMVGSGFTETISTRHFDTKEKYEQAIREAIRDPYFFLSITRQNRRKDGSLVWVNWSNRALYDDRGEITDIISVGNDISDLKESEQQLQRSKQHIQTMIDMAPFGAIEYERDDQGTLIFDRYNRSAESILNMDLKSLLSKPILEVFPDLEPIGIVDQFHAVLDTGKPFLNETVPYSTDEITGVFEVHALQSGANRVVVFFRDVTEKRKIEQDREELIEKLQEALDNVETLGGLIPICSMCKAIRDDQGYWNRIEQFISSHSGAEFTHGLCPGCADQMREEYNIKHSQEYKTKHSQE